MRPRGLGLAAVAIMSCGNAPVIRPAEPAPPIPAARRVTTCAQLRELAEKDDRLRGLYVRVCIAPLIPPPSQPWVTPSPRQLPRIG